MIKHIHHIIPRHMGGTDDPSNLIEVTIEEHAQLHKQLWEDLGDDKDRIAWLALSSFVGQDDVYKMLRSLGGKKAQQIVISNRNNNAQYDVEYRKKLSLGQSNRHKNGKGYIPTSKGYKHTEDTKRQLSEKNYSTNNSQYGTCWITNGIENKKIKKEELDSWLELGYNKGRINARVAQRQRHLP